MLKSGYLKYILEDNTLKMSGFVENFDNEEIIRVIYKDEFLFEGKAGALLPMLRRLFRFSGVSLQPTMMKTIKLTYVY